MTFSGIKGNVDADLKLGRCAEKKACKRCKQAGYRRILEKNLTLITLES